MQLELTINPHSSPGRAPDIAGRKWEILEKDWLQNFQPENFSSGEKSRAPSKNHTADSVRIPTRPSVEMAAPQQIDLHHNSSRNEYISHAKVSPQLLPELAGSHFNSTESYLLSKFIQGPAPVYSRVGSQYVSPHEYLSPSSANAPPNRSGYAGGHLYPNSGIWIRNENATVTMRTSLSLPSVNSALFQLKVWLKTLRIELVTSYINGRRSSRN